jgi:hypothetical protein
MNARKKNGTLSKFVPRKFSFRKGDEGGARKGKRKRWRKRKNKKTRQGRTHLWRFP